MNIKSSLFISILLMQGTTAFGLQISITGNNGVVGEKVESNTCSNYGEQSFTGDAGRTVYTTEQSYSDNFSLKMTAPEGSDGFGNFGGTIDFSACSGEDDFRLVKGDELWIRTRVFWPSDWEFNTGRNKFLRFRTFEDDVSYGYLDMYVSGNESFETPLHFINEGVQKWYTFGNFEDHLPRDQWVTYEVYYKLDNEIGSEGGEATVRVWVDGEFIGETFERATIKTEGTYINEFKFFTWFSNDGSPKDQSVYVDDIFITSDTPLNKDSAGNWYVGMGQPSTRSAPLMSTAVTKVVE